MRVLVILLFVTGVHSFDWNDIVAKAKETIDDAEKAAEKGTEIIQNEAGKVVEVAKNTVQDAFKEGSPLAKLKGIYDTVSNEGKKFITDLKNIDDKGLIDFVNEKGPAYAEALGRTIAETVVKNFSVPSGFIAKLDQLVEGGLNESIEYVTGIVKDKAACPLCQKLVHKAMGKTRHFVKEMDEYSVCLILEGCNAVTAGVGKVIKDDLGVDVCKMISDNVSTLFKKFNGTIQDPAQLTCEVVEMCSPATS